MHVVEFRQENFKGQNYIAQSTKDEVLKPHFFKRRSMDKVNTEARDPMPLVSSDKDGNKLRSQDEEETETLMLKDITFDDDFISSDGFTERVTEGPFGAATDHENEPRGREQCPIEDSNAAGLRNSNKIVSEMGDLAESSFEFDNSSDEDFQAGDKYIDSDAPRRMERRPVNTAQTHYPSEELNEGDWYSEPEDDEDIERAPGSDDEAPRHPQFIDGQNRKTFEMKVCLKFANVNVFRKAFKDWSVRHGYQFHYEKNERTRVTAVCAHDNCNYRIHASVVQGGPVFMV
ncbi:hypothetical protein CDL12_04656 [Handroanthus impetiginosus]|uniref:Transposase MuDR plant domain-containing protein n=1 Tax=Handroanthus impetiginosus TaxID=429701 RepID=A0A2G9HYR1_9LAMI|nr:hypothetical protein CDL12_04656 [Handroanthus impetiginosus]